ncbi:glycosyltransferase 61 family protein [Gluconobacter japonicus]|uniref:glycosyltransferase 61 family protein n=1 Tax=Gluconobacter japonicus TaxID=376620 RepID=UPI0009EC6A60|nr:glycosyltransferase 61 family protein [Gluconobacter japonicus]
MKDLIELEPTHVGDSVFDGAPEVHVIRRSLYIPFHENRESCGLYYIHKEAVEDSVPKRFMNSIIDISNNNPSKTYSDIYWGGYLDPHYGHFCIETLSNLWGYKKGQKILFHTLFGIDQLLSLPWVSYYFQFFGIERDNILEVSGTSSIKNLTFSKPSFKINEYIYDCFPEFLQKTKYEKRNTFCLKKKIIYVSRRGLKSGTYSITNESLLEDNLQKKGVTVLRVGDIKLEDQTSMFDNNIIISFSGSFLHNSIFVKNSKGICYCVDEIHSPEFSRKTFHMLDYSSKALFKYFIVDVNKSDAEAGFGSSFLIKNIKDLVEHMLVTAETMRSI